MVKSLLVIIYIPVNIENILFAYILNEGDQEKLGDWGFSVTAAVCLF